MYEFVRHLFKLQFLLIVVAVMAGIYYNQIIDWFLWRTGEPVEKVPLPYENVSESPTTALFTRQQLTQFNGENNAPLYLALLGAVFDVSKGIKHYGPGCAYNYFIGRDASVSFITGEFEKYDEEKADDVVTLKPSDLISLDNWHAFYRKEYTYKGRLIGRFYDDNGAPTSYYHKYQALLEQAKASKAQADQLRDIYPDCNIEWSVEKGTHVWCTTMSSGKKRQWIGHPRQLYEAGASTFRCACVQEKDLDTNDVMLKEYDNCARLAHECYYQVD